MISMNAAESKAEVLNFEVKKIGAAVASDAWSDAHSSAHARADDAQRELKQHVTAQLPNGTGYNEQHEVKPVGQPWFSS